MTILRLLMALVGVSMVLFGLWSIYPPAAFVAGGSLLIWEALDLGRLTDASSTPHK